MTTLRMLTAGESHGPALTVIIEGIPAGLAVRAESINTLLHARQQGYGRGGRMQIEQDTVQISAGVRHGMTMGSPICLTIGNRDYATWKDVMQPEPPSDLSQTELRPIYSPRPGHADLAGALKFGMTDMRNILERASARETAARVAAGAVAQLLLAACGVALRSHVLQIGSVTSAALGEMSGTAAWQRSADDVWWTAVEASPVRCGDATESRAMCAAIDAAREAKDSLGGIIEALAFNVPPGLGSCAHWDRRLDGRIAQAVLSIPSIKGVEIGAAWQQAARRGRAVHDPIVWDAATEQITRPTNAAGGLEGGMSNGEPIWLRAAVKPLSTVMNPLPSIDLRTHEATSAHLERADICVVPAAGLIAQTMLAWTLAAAVLEKFGSDSMAELKRNMK